MQDNINKPVRPKQFIPMNVGGNDIKPDSQPAKQPTYIEQPEEDKQVPMGATHVAGQIESDLPKRKRARAHHEKADSEQLISELAKLGTNSVSELLSQVKQLSSMTTEQLLECPEGIIYLGSKYGFSYDSNFAPEMNRFIAKANLMPKTKARLSEEDKQFSYAERYPHMQVSRKYKMLIDDIAGNANVPATVILRLLLDIALTTVGVKMDE